MNKQQTEILQLLKYMGDKGVNSFEWRRKWIQLPVRIKELKSMGYIIVARPKVNRSVDYVLLHQPETKKEEPKKQEQSWHWEYDNKRNVARHVENTPFEPVQLSLI